MKKFNLNTTFRKLKGATAIAAIILPTTFGWSGSVHAAECAPLQVSGFELLNAKSIKQGGSVVGVEFYVRSHVKNTNANLHVSFNPRTSVNLIAYPSYVKPGDRRAISLGNHTFSTHLAPGYKTAFISEKVTVMRDPKNLTKLSVNLNGHVYNAQCSQNQNRKISTSKFKFDLVPVLGGRPAKRVSGRITGYSESSRPRPRPRTGSSAPRPRT